MPDKIAPEKTDKPPKKEKAKRWLDWWSVRIGLLVLAAYGGLLLAKCGKFLLLKLKLINLTLASNTQLTILLMSLPVLFVLWIFRTWDTQEHIKKAGESAEAARKSAETARESTETAKRTAEIAKQSERTARENVETAQKSLSANRLARNIEMLSANDLRTKCIGLIQLAEIKRQGHFVEEIDRATRQSLQLSQANLKGENLSRVNLRHAMMHQTVLVNTILTEADLQWSTLTEVIFTGADLRSANLRDADLRGAKNLEFAKLEGAKYNDGTKFPESFEADREKNAKKMKMEYFHGKLTRP